MSVSGRSTKIETEKKIGNLTEMKKWFYFKKGKQTLRFAQLKVTDTCKIDRAFGVLWILDVLKVSESNKSLHIRADLEGERILR